MTSALDKLAERVGIEAEFVDALGTLQQTPEAKKRALLQVMDLSAGTEAEAEHTLEALDRQEWEEVLPRCVVLYADRDLAVPVTLPQGHGTVRWKVTLESGAQRTGKAAYEELQKVAERQIDGALREHRLLVLPADIAWGYHQLEVMEADGPACRLIVTPGRCWLPDEDEQTARDEGQERFWGVAAQTYLLRSERNWGMGDFTDLRELIEIVRQHGADAVGVNPLHAMFLDLPEQSSPYSPQSRYLLNVLNIDVEAIPEFAGCEAALTLQKTPGFQERLNRARASAMVAYEDVAALKLPVLQAVFAHFEQHASEARKVAFQRFQDGCDELALVSCTYAALREYLLEQDIAFRDCGRWPAEWMHAEAPGVTAFEQDEAHRVRYQRWLQFVADEQLAAVKRACEGMKIGLYRDLAVGANPCGAEIWSNPEVMVRMAEVGAPPDILNTAGQNWVLPPFHPQKMKADGYRSFAALLRTNMRHAGGLRIDHAMALQRLYWIPRGGTPRDGGYVRYPLIDLIGVIALESHRNRCLVVGEDLGTVPPGFRQHMADAQILSYKVLLLEEETEGAGYVKGSSYQRMALSTASNHDLPTLRGWWEEADVDLRERLGFLPPDAARAARTKRNADREAMLEMFREDGLLEGRSWPLTEEFVDAAHRFLARTRSVLMMVQIEDILEEREQVNLPASMPDQYPSWGRRVPETLNTLRNDPRLERVARITREERGVGRLRQSDGPTRT